MIFFLNKVYRVTQKQVIKQGAGIFLILSHYIYRVAVLLFRGEEPMQNVRIPQRYCICRVRSKPKFNVVTWFATTAVWLLVRKRLCFTVNKFTEINVCPVLYFLLLRWHQVFFSVSTGISKCKYQSSYNHTTSKTLLSLNDHHGCPLDYSPLPGKLLLIASYLLLLLPGFPSNVCMCCFVQCQLGNAPSFKAAALGGLILWEKNPKKQKTNPSGCLFKYCISKHTNTESSS